MPVLKERRCKELQDTDIHQTPVYYALGSKAESMGSVHSDREARRLGAREAAGGKENMQILSSLIKKEENLPNSNHETTSFKNLVSNQKQAVKNTKLNTNIADR